MIRKAIGPKRLQSNFNFWFPDSSFIFRYIPVRNKITLAEKNPHIKRIADQKQFYLQELLRIVHENTHS